MGLGLKLRRRLGGGLLLLGLGLISKLGCPLSVSHLWGGQATVVTRRPSNSNNNTLNNNLHSISIRSPFTCLQYHPSVCGYDAATYPLQSVSIKKKKLTIIIGPFKVLLTTP